MSHRDLRKSIEEYKKKFSNGRTNEGAFYMADFEQIINLANENVRGKGSNIGWYSFYLIDNALMAGFMIGYRKGVRDQRQREAMKNK